jgi:biopolymer transport protein ExbD
MAKSGDKPAVIGEINITPLTDIFLVLLIIMMVVTPLLDFAGLQTTAPPKNDTPAQEQEEKKAEEKKEKSKSIAITINDENTIMIAGDILDIPSLGNIAEQLAPLVPEHPEGVLITVSAKAELKSLTKVMEACRNAGIMKVQVVKSGS